VPQSVFAQYCKVSAYPNGVWSNRNPYTVNDFFQQDTILQQKNDTCITVSEELPLLLLVRDFWEGFFDKLPWSDPSQPLISVCRNFTAHGKHAEIDVSQHHNSYVSWQDTSSEHLNLVESSLSSDQKRPESQHLLRDRRSNTSEFDGSTLCGSDRDETKLCGLVQLTHPMFLKDFSTDYSTQNKTQLKISAEWDSAKQLNSSCQIIKMNSLSTPALLKLCVKHMSYIGP